MPRLDILLLPLLGGYIFLTTFNLTRFYYQRIEKQRLLYNSLVVAFILIAISYIFDYYILKSNFQINLLSLKTEKISYYRQEVSNKITDILSHPLPRGFKHSLLAFLLSYPFAFLLNQFRWFRTSFAFDYTIHKWGNELDRLIWDSLSQKDDLAKLLMLTTKNNKVYIGHITKLSEPLGNTYLRIIPSLSGYREKDTLKLVITTNYTDIIQSSAENGETEKLDNKLGVIIPVSEIVLLSKFDHEIFGRFNLIKEKDTTINDTKENNGFYKR